MKNWFRENKVISFFREEAHPLNLAVFRIAVFWTLFLTAGLSRTIWFSKIPRELVAVPPGLGRLVPYFLMSENLAWIAAIIFMTSCITGMIGLFTRTSAAIATLLGFYVIGVQQIYGKLNHEHHLLWFAAILVVSQSADVFSVDGIFKAFRRADKGDIAPPGPSKVYGLPLCFVLILIGSIYLFPGFWKIRETGIEWFWSDNLKWHLYRKWVELGDWVPFFRIDRHPMIYRFAAFGTIIFELSFIFLILFPRLRTGLGFAGLTFHTFTNLFMQIPFWQLQTCYVVFFDWHKIFSRVGKFLFHETMFVVYDGNCKLCRRTIASVRVFDFLERIYYVNALDREAVRNNGLDWLDSGAIQKDMHAVIGRKTGVGFAAYQALARRIPILWPVLPFLYLWPVPFFGKRVYRHVADSRACDIVKPPAIRETRMEILPSVKGVWVVGIFLLAVNSIFGILKIHSWPFTVYPTFDWLTKETRTSMRIVSLDGEGKEIPINEKFFRRQLTNSRWMSFFTNGLGIKDEEQRRAYLKALWRFCAANEPALRNTVSVLFKKVVLTGDPDRRHENPLSEELIFTWDHPEL